jgi:hypothetical protein
MKAFIASLFRFSLIAMFFATAISFATTIPLEITAPVVFGGYVLMNLHPSQFTNVLGVGINKEVWLSILAENFYPADTGWFSRSIDHSPLVENDRINWAIIGADPTIYVNRDTVANPIPITPRTDTHAYVDLDTLDTENTPVTNIEKMELAYDKMASVIRQHKKSLLAESLKRAAYSWCPATNGAGFVISTTGTTNAGHKRFVIDDLSALAAKWNSAEYPAVGRVFMLHYAHLQDLQFQDKDLYKTLINLKTGQPLHLHGFDIYTGATVMPRYNKSTSAKVAYGAAPAGTDSPASSIAWIDSEVFRADGSYDMFDRSRDPEIRADFVGFQKRFVAGQTASRGVGAIVTVV